MKNNRKPLVCPSCNDLMNIVSEEIDYIIVDCKISGAKADAVSSELRGGEVRDNTDSVIRHKEENTVAEL